MKLYFTKGTCSLCPQIVLSELGADVEMVPVNLKEKLLPDGSDYRAVNPKGYVPFLETDEGFGLSECQVMIQYLADRHPEAGLAPAPGTVERVRLQEWLSFIGSELHKNFPPMFLPYVPDDYRPVARARVTQRLEYLDGQLAGRDYLMGKDFSIGDAYGYTILRWSVPAKYDLTPLRRVKAWFDSIGERPAVKAALAAEG